VHARRAASARPSRRCAADTAPPAHPTATERDGAPALAVGLAANRGSETGRPVRTGALITV
jgi:hypothetical protein